VLYKLSRCGKKPRIRRKNHTGTKNTTDLPQKNHSWQDDISAGGAGETASLYAAPEEFLPPCDPCDDILQAVSSCSPDHFTGFTGGSNAAAGYRFTLPTL